MLGKEWLTKYESKIESLRCKIDLDAYFTEKKIGKINLDVLNIGKVSFPTGKIIACDPLIELDDAPAYIQNIPPGNYDVDISVALSEKFGDRYSCTEKKIGKINLDVLNIGKVSFPTGKIIACDPLIELDDAPAYIQNIPPGNYDVDISVALSEKFGDRYSCVKVLINDNKPVYYDLGVIGNEDLDEELEDDEYFGFCVDAGMGCT